MTAQEYMERYGYTREEAEREAKQDSCEHDYGKMCRPSFMGCYRTCIKCGQMVCLARHCGGSPLNPRNKP